MPRTAGAFHSPITSQSPAVTGALQHAAVVVPVQVIVAAALRGPEDLAPFRQEIEVVVQIHPGVAALGEELARRAAGDGEGEDVEPLLVACLPLHQQPVAFGVPFDAREVAVLCAEVAAGRRAGVEREDRERHLGVRPPGRGIALLAGRARRRRRSRSARPRRPATRRRARRRGASRPATTSSRCRAPSPPAR